MTQTNDPPLVASVALIPDSDEKADLDAPSSQSGKLLVSQAPNITITSTSVVADQAERLALDPQEGDIAIQQDTTESFIFTGGANELANWQLVKFDAVGGIAGEDIAPRDIEGRNVVVTDIDTDTIDAITLNSDNLATDSLNGADLQNANAGEVLTSDGAGNASFSSPPGLPSGAIVMWGGLITNIPTGFSLCDGSGTTPDLRDRFVIGAGGAETIGETGGANSVTLSENELPSHSHGVSDPGHAHTVTSGNINGSQSRGGGQLREPQTRTTSTETTGITINNTGADQAHENRPSYLALAYIQKD